MNIISNVYGYRIVLIILLLAIGLFLSIDVIELFSYLFRIIILDLRGKPTQHQLSIETYTSVCSRDDGMKEIIMDPEAKCLDGSPPVYYIRRGYGDGLNKWNIFFEGIYILLMCNIK